MLVVISAPSGAGKSTICRLLQEKNPDYKLSVSATTRLPRKDEQQGVHYFFMTESEFLNHINQHHFIEYEKVHGNYYGTLQQKLEPLMVNGGTILFDIDVNGALRLKHKFPEAVLIFIRPPSIRELQRRLKGRKSESEEQIQERLKRLPEEYNKAKFFDYDIVNNDLAETLNKIEKIIQQHQKQEKHVPHKSV